MMTVMGLAEPLERAAELEKLSALLAAAREGRGQVCVIEGPSGVGKSRLLERVRGFGCGAWDVGRSGPLQ